jgi:hypothetical protein
MTAFRAILLAVELESLRQLTLGALQKRIPARHGEALVRGGFARMRAGTLIVTTLGHAKLALEITRASWLAAPV